MSYLPYSLSIITVSCLLHDLGKINSQFQRKLMETDKNKISDYARHEYISFDAFQRMIKYTQSKYKLTTEKDILGALSNTTHLKESIIHSIDSVLYTDTDDITIMNDVFKTSFPTLYSIMFIIISHHLLPSSHFVDKGMKVVSNTKKHINKRITDEENKHLSGVYDKTKNNFLLSDSFINYLAKEFSNLSVLCNNQYKHYHSLMSLYDRTAVIFADRYVSSCKPVNDIYPLDAFYANTKRLDDGSIIYSQTLEEHLLKVTSGARSSIKKLYRLLDDHKLPTVEHIPDTLTSQKKCNEYYSWQNGMLRQIKRRERECIKDSGFFGVVMAGTGRGKTRANAKLMVALSHKPRFTLGVGLRTLTLQTNTEYCNDLGLDNKDVGMLIGSELSKKLYECITEEAELEELSGEFVSNLENYNNVLGEAYDNMLKDKERKMIYHPVIVCTTDHLMSIANMRKGKQLASCLRVMTSDLILDEIDSYSETDLVALGKLVYRTGQAGKKVILSSATVESSVIEGLYYAYAKGYECYCDAHDVKRDVFYGLFSEYSKINVVNKISRISFEKNYEMFMTNFINNLNKEPARRKGTLIDIQSCKKRADAFNVIFNRCKVMHRDHGVIHNGVKISFGAVRFNTINNCRDFATSLYGMNTNVTLKVLCYHSKTFPLYLNEQEKTLNEIMKRKNPTAVFDHELVKDIIQKAKDNDSKHVMIVVSTTSIEEIGRDHDFDYGITEPHSYRSLVQFSGRIMRHRHYAIDKANIGVLSRTLERVEQKFTNVPVSDQELEINIFKSLAEDSRKEQKPNDTWYKTGGNSLYDILDLDIFDNINASILFKKINSASDLMAKYAYYKKKYAIDGTEKDARVNILSLKSYVDNDILQHSQYHYEKNPFRFSQESIIFYKDNSGFWYYTFESDEKKVYDASRSVRHTSINTNSRSLLDFREESLYHDMIIKLGIADDPLMCNYLRAVNIQWYSKSEYKSVQYQPVIEFNPYIGAKHVE